MKHIEERNSAKYIEKNEIFARNFVKWLVNRNRTSNLMKNGNHCNLVGAANYELDFRKFDKIADDACDYFQSKKRILTDGSIVDETKNNLGAIRTAIR